MGLFNRAIVAVLSAVPEALLWQFARRYVAGVTLQDAAQTVRALNARGLLATLDILGEHMADAKDARADGLAYAEVLHAIRQEDLLANISVKPTHMGLKLDPDLCLGILQDLVGLAHRLGSFVRLDMEDSTCTDETLRLYCTLVKGTPAVGVVLQAYLKRSQEDAKRLAEGQANVRVCKGIYQEPETIALKDRQAIRRNFVALLEILMEAGSYIGIATHDSWVIQEAQRLIRRVGVPRERYEFQMLLGVRPDIRERLRAQGEHLRIYVPFGQKWRPYCLRRFRENPEILGHVVRAFWRRGS